MRLSPRAPVAAPRTANGFAALGVLAVLIVCLSAALAQTLTFPALAGRVVDDAAVLDSATRASLTEKLAALETKSTDQLVVATVRSLQGTSVEDYANRLFREWRLGQQGKNNGVLMLVAPNDRKVRIEVGYGLEGTLPDAVSKLIIENAILPRFRANDFAGGISRGVDDVIQVLTDNSEEWKQRAAGQRPKSQLTEVQATVIFFLVAALGTIFAFIYNYHTGRLAPQLARRRDRRGTRDSWWDSSSSGSSWSSGGGSWDSGSSGGFSGGGGDSGGGGASGSW
jgi:uncharacterized protein